MEVASSISHCWVTERLGERQGQQQPLLRTLPVLPRSEGSHLTGDEHLAKGGALSWQEKGGPAGSPCSQRKAHTHH